ncbi:ABC1 family protein [Agromyces ramosus]|uniref:ABC1 family protein n=1 Tax=Agromyces ramosus TaxID=33879 RepID=A0A4Q7MNL8_9MICO|nr:ABC1 family protein [Agromyces ramosus]
MRARYRRILRFAARYIVQTWWFELVLPRFGLARFAARGRTARLTRIAQRFHVLAVDLGGLMIKVGQYLSSRLDILPPEITKELAGLQDEVPPVPFDAIQRLAEAELGVPLERAYASFDPTPLAAASLGQAHRARLAPIVAADMGYDEAVVKVQRPGIETIVAVDLKALRRVAGWLSRVRFVANHVDLPSLVEEFAVTSLQEIDYLQEAGNAKRGEQVVADPQAVVHARDDLVDRARRVPHLDVGQPARDRVRRVPGRLVDRQRPPSREPRAAASGRVRRRQAPSGCHAGPTCSG